MGESWQEKLWPGQGVDPRTMGLASTNCGTSLRCVRHWCEPQPQQELSAQGDCLLWGIRVVVPQKLQKLRARLVEELHCDHLGVTRMKEVARSYLWWLELDK